jgi:hypothetical protein
VGWGGACGGVSSTEQYFYDITVLLWHQIEELE